MGRVSLLGGEKRKRLEDDRDWPRHYPAWGTCAARVEDKEPETSDDRNGGVWSSGWV